jgi:hypothetical protein
MLTLRFLILFVGRFAAMGTAPDELSNMLVRRTRLLVDEGLEPAPEVLLLMAFEMRPLLSSLLRGLQAGVFP